MSRVALRFAWKPGQPSLPPPAAWRVVAEDYGSTTSAECPDLVSGTLRIESGDDVAEFHPSAPASCFGEEKTECTAWSLNGEDQPEMCGFLWLSKGTGCSAGPDAPPPWAAMAILLAGLLWQRYRRRASSGQGSREANDTRCAFRKD
jgi:MYXO-CTERM domain-containing protein